MASKVAFEEWMALGERATPYTEVRLEDLFECPGAGGEGDGRGVISPRTSWSPGGGERQMPPCDRQLRRRIAFRSGSRKDRPLRIAARGSCIGSSPAHGTSHASHPGRAH